MKITVKDAAATLGCSEQTIRVGLQQGVFPWGWAVKTSGNYTYVISEKLFKEMVGDYE